MLVDTESVLTVVARRRLTHRTVHRVDIRSWSRPTGNEGSTAWVRWDSLVKSELRRKGYNGPGRKRHVEFGFAAPHRWLPLVQSKPPNCTFEWRFWD